MSRFGNKWVFLLINVTAAFCVGVLLVLIAQREDHLQKTIDKGFQIIQQQRRTTIFIVCRHGNKDHEAASVALTRFLPALENRPLSAAETKAVDDYLNAAIPKRNCAALAKLAVPDAPTP